MSKLVLSGLGKSFGTFHAVQDVSLTLQEGEFVSLLGPSGCGKTTTLRLIAGFLQPTSGRILIAGRDVTHDPPNRRAEGCHRGTDFPPR